MPTITVDGKKIECKDRQMILQACKDSGIEIPHYCYHPGLSIVASCRICLVEVEGIPKLVPGCQTPVRDGMVVYTQSTKAVANQKQVMEYLLVNHPLDCPVCDKAGECSLQDYSYNYGRSQSRFEEDKSKNPKKDVGEHVLLYTDRCIMCTRCVRFTREVAGTSELFVDGRGHKEEIEIFPGKPLNNKISLNVVDLCPVGALLDKSFLFAQRVWMLKRTPSVSPVDAGGENIWIDQNENAIYRIKPRFNEKVNSHWISNDTRHAYKAVLREDRLVRAKTRQLGALSETRFADALKVADEGLKTAAKNGPLFAVVSPMLPTEEAYLLGQYIRSIDANATLVIGPVPTTADDTFKHYNTGKETFRIQGEKVPNRRGVERALEKLGGARATWADFVANPDARFAGGFVTGGYLSSWLTEVPAVLKNKFVVVQDVLPNALTEAADVVLPGAMWCEKDGSFENFNNTTQAFVQAIIPPGAAQIDGKVFHKLLAKTGEYHVEQLRADFGGPLADVVVPASEELTGSESPAMEFAEL
jgi:NADH-quinone oxidoreductase subunit G